MMEATRQFASVNGITLSYFDVGAGEPVLLLHGFPDDALIWAEQVDALVAAGYRCIVPDLRGFGESEAPTDRNAYRASEVVANLIGLLEDVITINGGASTTRGENGRKNSHHCGFSRTVGSEKAKNLAFGHLEGNPAQSGEFPIVKGFNDVVGFDREFGHRATV